MQFSKVLYWQHDIFKGPFLINKVQNRSLDYACGVSVKRYRLWKRWIGALLAWAAFAFLVTISGEDRAGAAFFRTEENLFSRSGELSVRKKASKGRAVAADFKFKRKTWSSRCSEVNFRFLAWVKPRCPAWGGWERDGKFSLQRANWECSWFILGSLPLLLH